VGYADNGNVIKTNLLKNNEPFLIPNFDGRTRAWFQGASSSGKAGFSEPYVDVTTKNLTTAPTLLFLMTKISLWHLG